jgi:hypothetical protein
MHQIVRRIIHKIVLLYKVVIPVPIKSPNSGWLVSGWATRDILWAVGYGYVHFADESVYGYVYYLYDLYCVRFGAPGVLDIIGVGNRIETPNLLSANRAWNWTRNRTRFYTRVYTNPTIWVYSFTSLFLFPLLPSLLVLSLFIDDLGNFINCLISVISKQNCISYVT